MYTYMYVVNSLKALNIMITLLHVTSPPRGRDQLCTHPTSGTEFNALNYILGIFSYITLPAVHNKHPKHNIKSSNIHTYIFITC